MNSHSARPKPRASISTQTANRAEPTSRAAASSYRSLLYITYDFPPSSAVAAVRSGKLVKYLPRFGWRPIVITADFRQAGTCQGAEDNLVRLRPPLLRPTTSPFPMPGDATRGGYLKRSISAFLGIMRPIYTLPLIRMVTVEPFTWHLRARREAAKLARHDSDIALVFSSYGPSSAHFAAHDVSRSANLPWVAEFRDLWTNNPYMHERHIPLLTRLAQRIEVAVMRSAKLLVGISEPMKSELEAIHHKVVVAIPSGFDPDDYATPVPLTPRFTLTYTGVLYGGRRDPSALFEALTSLQEEYPDILQHFELRFVGGDTETVLSRHISSQRLAHVVTFYPNVPLTESLRMQRESTALLLLSWNDPRDAGTLPAKLFQYLGARRPILATSVYPQGSIASLLSQTGCGIVANEARDIKAVLKTWLEEHGDTGKLRSNFSPDEVAVSEYTWEAQARKLAHEFDVVVSKSNNML